MGALGVLRAMDRISHDVVSSPPPCNNRFPVSLCTVRNCETDMGHQDIGRIPHQQFRRHTGGVSPHSFLCQAWN
eukprot:2662887-Rhodomonas_salina.1